MTPGLLFATLWGQVQPQAYLLFAEPWLGRRASEYNDMCALIRGCETEDVPAEVERYLNGEHVDFASQVPADKFAQRAFVVMCALDEAAMDIHPASRTRIGGRIVEVSECLLAMKVERTANGFYARLDGVGTVIPKGRLASRREESEADDASGVNLETQFEYLTVIGEPPAPYALEYLVMKPSDFSLSPDRASQVGVAPIAEDADDLIFSAIARRGKPFLDAQPADAPSLAQRLGDRVTHLLDQGAGIVTLPELVAPPPAIEALGQRLRSRPADGGGALVICGSGLSVELDADLDRPFNEAVVMNGTGEVLFKQRKIHPFNMSGKRMKDCGVPFDPGFVGKAHMEDIAPAVTLTVCDLHDIGRIMVLICEDIEQDKVTAAAAHSTRPDWIFNPVLDISQEPGRWTHQRSIEIARKTGSKIVVSSSSSLTVRYHKASALATIDPTAVGIALLYDGAAGRKVSRIHVASAGEPQAVVTVWSPDSWQGDDVGFKAL